MAAAGKKATEGRQGSKSKELMSDRSSDRYILHDKDRRAFFQRKKGQTGPGGIHTRQILVDGREP